MWDVLKQVFRDSEVYGKQFVLFLVVLGVGFSGWGTYRYVTSSTSHPQAATELASSLQPKQDTDVTTYDVVIDKDAGVTVNGKSVKGAITYESGRAQFLLVLSRDSQVYISSLRSLVHLPKADPPASALQPRIYAIHGVVGADEAVVDNQTLAFVAQEVPAAATVSIGLTFPQGYFNDALVSRFESKVSTLSPTTWVALGSVFPFLTLIFLLILVTRRSWINQKVKTSDVASKFPSQLPPGMVGALYHGRIGPREITATLFSLADRGFVGIYHGIEENEVAFSKGTQLYTQKTATLRPYEIFLLHQIFGDNQNITNESQIAVSLESELFSSKIAMAMVNLYDGLVGEGFYIQSPNRYFLRYQLMGMALFFIAAAGALYGSFVLPEPAYILFAWFGMMVAALLIVRVTPGLPTRTNQGTDVLRQWMAFRNYLTLKDPVSGVQPSQFFDYLPYAIVLDCVDDWIVRWRNETIVLPHWFTAAETPHSADDYKNSLVAVITYLSKHLVATRPPTLA